MERFKSQLQTTHAANSEHPADGFETKQFRVTNTNAPAPFETETAVVQLTHAMSTTEPPKEKTPGQRILKWFVITVVLCLVYALSFGPAILLNERGIVSPQTLEMVYLPLSLVAHIPGGQWLFEKYAELWVGPMK